MMRNLVFYFLLFGLLLGISFGLLISDSFDISDYSMIIVNSNAFLLSFLILLLRKKYKFLGKKINNYINSTEE